MPADAPVLIPDSLSADGLAGTVGSVITLAFVCSVSAAASVVEEVEEVEGMDEVDEMVVWGDAKVVESCPMFDWDSSMLVGEVVASLSVEVEEELVDDFGVLVPALDPLNEAKPTNTLVVTG
jgi:hypothetical protein